MNLLSKFYQDERWKRYSLVTAKKLSKAFTQGQIQLKPTVVEKNLLPFQLIRLNTIQFRKGHFETLLNAYGEYYLSTLPLKRDSRVFSFILCLTSELPFCYSSPGDSPCFDRWRTTITYVTVFPGNGDSMLYRGGRETRPNEIGITCPKEKRNITTNSQLRWSQIRRDFRTAP